MAETEAAPKKAALTRTVKDKWRAKHWFKVRAPGLFAHAELGETMATEPESVVGRTLETTLPEISGGVDAAKAHIKLRFQIERITGENVAETRLVGHELTTDYVRRLARRKKSKIDAVVTVTTKDGVQFLLKAVAVGEQRLQSHLRTELKNRLVTLLTETARSRTAADFVREMLGGELARILSQGLRTLYPLKKIEIRTSEVLGAIAEERAGPEGPAPPEVPAEGGAPAAPASA